MPRWRPRSNSRRQHKKQQDPRTCRVGVMEFSINIPSFSHWTLFDLHLWLPFVEAINWSLAPILVPFTDRTSAVIESSPPGGTCDSLSVQVRDPLKLCSNTSNLSTRIWPRPLCADLKRRELNFGFKDFCYLLNFIFLMGKSCLVSFYR